MALSFDALKKEAENLPATDPIHKAIAEHQLRIDDAVREFKAKQKIDQLNQSI